MTSNAGAPDFSVIIPLHVSGPRFAADLMRVLALENVRYEVIVVSDRPFDLPVEDSRLRVLLTGADLTGPAQKRDLAVSQALGKVCAFLDDDAYPAPDWLDQAARVLTDPEVAAVGGPGLTPPEDGLLAQAGGAVYASLLGSGGLVYRFARRQRRLVDDYPAYNLIIRKDVLDQIGGFNSTYYGGEDTKVCLAIIALGKQIVYDPQVAVYHHRRPLFGPHLRQIANVGQHRGFFAKAYPQTSLRLAYFLPSLLALSLLAGAVLAVALPELRGWFLAGIAIYWALALISAWMAGSDLAVTGPLTRIKIALLASMGIVATHLVYGLAFLGGLSRRKLDR